LQAPLTEDKLILLAKVCYLKGDKMTVSAGSKFIFVAVYAHGVVLKRVPLGCAGAQSLINHFLLHFWTMSSQTNF
jgi:hypothetical protein